MTRWVRTGGCGSEEKGEWERIYFDTLPNRGAQREQSSLKMIPFVQREGGGKKNPIFKFSDDDD